jgi:hypothetical protein
MKPANAPHALRMFTVHLLGASLVFGTALVALAAGLLLLRWAIPLEHASSSPHRALEASRHILELHEGFWPAAGASLFALGVAAVWLGRRLRGPLTRYRDVFARVEAGGTPAPIAIRATDYLAEETAALNTMLDGLAARDRLRAERCAALLDELDELARGSDPGSSSRIARAHALAKSLADGSAHRA